MTPAEITSIIGVILCAIFLVFAEHRVDRTKGKKPLFHAAFVAFATAVLFLMPETIQYDLFSPLGVVIVGSVFPIYESIRAVCKSVFIIVYHGIFFILFQFNTVRVAHKQ